MCSIVSFNTGNQLHYEMWREIWNRTRELSPLISLNFILGKGVCERALLNSKAFQTRQAMQLVKHQKASSSTSNHEPHFFKFLFPDPFGSQRIPLNFYKHLPTIVPKQAFLVTQSGKLWIVDVRQNEEGIHFSRGWSEFAKAHDMQLGYFVVFRYEGKMVFNVQVFDTTCCLKDYSLTHCKSPTVKLEPSNFLDLTLDVKSDEIPVEPGKERKIDSGKAQLVCKESREEEEPILKGKKKKKMKIQRSSPDMPIVPQFEKKLYRSSVSKARNAVTIPKKFCVDNDLISERKMFLTNSKGKKWRAKLCIRGHVLQLTKGWYDFSKKNGLKERDVCIFQLINKNTFLVYVAKSKGRR